MKLSTFGTALSAFVILGSQPTGAFAQMWLHIPDGVVQNGINLGDIDVSGDQLTLEALVSWRPSQSTDIVSKHTNPNNVNYLFRLLSMEIRTSQGYAYLDAPFELCFDSVYHHSATYDGSVIKYYLNGNVIASMPWSGNLFTNNLDACISNMQQSLAEQMRGYIDEVRIWNVARSAAEIQANMYTLPDPANQPGLLAYYTFEGDYVNIANPGTWDGVPIGTQIGMAPNPGFTGQVNTGDCLATAIQVNGAARDCFIYPNPANSSLLIELTAADVSASVIRVINGLGQLMPVPSHRMNAQGGTVSRIALDIGQLPPATYLLLATTESGLVRKPFIKE